MTTPDAIKLFLSPAGDDRWSGRLPAPASGGGGPLATFDAARDAVRRLRDGSGRLPAPVEVVVAGGTYFLPRTLELDPCDSGTSECPVTFRAAQGEQPVLSGGQPITGWREAEFLGRPCWAASVEAGWDFTQLFVDGRRRSRPRLPEQGYYRFAGLPEGHGTYWRFPVQTAQFAPGEIQPWANLPDVELVTLHHWFENRLLIAAVDADKCVVTFEHKTRHDLWAEGGLPCRYYVENVPEALIAGQWYLDRAAARVYYMPLGGEARESFVAVAPRLGTLVMLRGEPRRGGARVSHVRFEGLAFHHAEYRLPRRNPGAVQAAYILPGAVVLQGASHCDVLGCEVAHVSQFGIEVRRGSDNCRVAACHVHDLGAGGVKVNNEGPLRKGSLNGDLAFEGMDDVLPGWGSADEDLPGEVHLGGMWTTICDCEIHDGGILYPSADGIWIGDSGCNHVHHNHVHDFDETGISVGWTWGYGPVHARNNVIEHNHIHDIGRGVMNDLGGIYAVGLLPGTILRGNVIHDCTGFAQLAPGLYTDEGCSFILIENNICYRTTSGFLQHFGSNNIVRNNIFADSETCDIATGRGEAMRGLTLEHNIVLGRGSELLRGDAKRHRFDADGNLYWSAAGNATLAGLDFAAWQGAGYDAHGRLADPRFIDASNRDFRLVADSPALAAGFKPFVPDVGPRGGADQWGASGHQACPPAAGESLAPRPIPYATLEAGPLQAYTLKAPMTISLTTDTPHTLRLIVRNAGDLPARGRAAIRALPVGDACVGADAAFDYDLAPGQQAAHEFTLTLAPRAGRVCVEAFGEGLLGAAIHVDARRRCRIPAGPALAGLQDVPAAVAACEPLAMGDLGHIRFAVAGPDLAVQAKVRDRIQRQGPQVWDGSVVEIYGAMPGRKDIGQVFLLPATAAAAAKAYRQQAAGQEPAPEIRVATRNDPTGYELTALVPLSLLAADAAGGEILLDAAISAAPDPSSITFSRANLSGAADSFADNSGYLVVELMAPGRKH